MIRIQTKEILGEPTFEDVEHSTLCIVLSQPAINADEASLFEAMVVKVISTYLIKYLTWFGLG